MNGRPLLAWREQFDIAERVASAVLGITPELYSRIETGEVDPTPELALRIHIVTGGHVPLSTWEQARVRLLDGGLRLAAIVGRHAGGGFGVNLYIGSEVIARLDPGAASAFGEDVQAAAAMAANPPVPLPVLPFPAYELEAVR